MLDAERLRLTSAFKIAQLKPEEVVAVLSFMEESPDEKLREKSLQQLLQESQKSNNEDLSEDRIKEILLSE